MSISEYDETDLADDSYNDIGILGFEIAYSSGNRTAIKKTAKNKLKIKRKLDNFQERRRMSKETDTLFGDWEH